MAGGNDKTSLASRANTELEGHFSSRWTENHWECPEINTKLFQAGACGSQIWKAMQVPHVLEEKVEQELERLLESWVMILISQNGQLPCTHSETRWKGSYLRRLQINGNQSCEDRDWSCGWSAWNIGRRSSLYKAKLIVWMSVAGVVRGIKTFCDDIPYNWPPFGGVCPPSLKEWCRSDFRDYHMFVCTVATSS